MAARRRYPTPAERRQRNREEVREAILAVSREVMREAGVAALNLNEVARRLGMTTPAIYKYFSSKAAIYDELFKRAQQTFLAYVHKAVPPEAGFWDTWKAVAMAQMEFAHDYPELYALGFQRPVPGFTPSEESLAVSQAVADEGESLIRKGMESGEIRTELSGAQVRDMLFALTAGLTSAYIANEPHLPPGRGRFGGLAEHLIKVLKVAWGDHTT